MIQPGAPTPNHLGSTYPRLHLYPSVWTIAIIERAKASIVLPVREVRESNSALTDEPDGIIFRELTARFDSSLGCAVVPADAHGLSSCLNTAPAPDPASRTLCYL